MVARSDGDGFIDIEALLELGIDLRRQGEDPTAAAQVEELERAGWISQMRDGGWDLGDTARALLTGD